MSTIYNERIGELRQWMRDNALDAVMVPLADPHGSEYVASYWKSLKWLTGFSGSAAKCVVTPEETCVWVDSRYWLQAHKQLDESGIVVMEEGKPGVPSLTDYILAHHDAIKRVGIDGLLCSYKSAVEMRDKFSAVGIELVSIADPFADIWKDRPGLPSDKLFVHSEVFAGESAGSKLARLREVMIEAGCEAVLIAELSEIAWLLNVRSNDVRCSPVAISYLYVGEKEVILFVDPRKLTPEVEAYLAKINVKVSSYLTAASSIDNAVAGKKVMVDPSTASLIFMEMLSDRAVEFQSPVALWKSVKNPVQIEGVKNAHIKDGVALVKGFMELERRMSAGEHLTETDVAEILERYRSGQPLFLELSFDTIAGYGANGAVVHYTAEPSTAAVLKPEGFLLVDSGATYLDGTTDITRTIALGPLTEEMKRDFTLVLKGHVDLARAVFPVGTRGAQLDVLARADMWRYGLTYLHGTGHGVGQCLNVHEGPQSIRLQENPVAFLPGMLTSDEPGVYRAGRYGIRTENLLLTVAAFSNEEYGEFLRFESVTLFPYDLSAVDRSLLNEDEIAWINDYHDRVYSALSPYLDEEGCRWLRAKCGHIDCK